MSNAVKRGYHIAIDGPVAAGKSSVAKKVAERLGFLYIDTGAMYRAVTWLCLEKRVPVAEESLILALMKTMRLEMHPPRLSENQIRLYTVIVNGLDVSEAIRELRVSQAVSEVAAHPLVRQELVKRQQEIAQHNNVVMEGRDITYRVLPDAQLRIYLTASEDVRAQRHFRQLSQQGEIVTLEQVKTALLKRDSYDMSRKTDPLKVVEGAWVLDGSDDTIDEIVAKIVAKVPVKK